MAAAGAHPGTPAADGFEQLQASILRGPVACVDLETTGGSAALHRVIEVGIVLLDDGRIVDEWSSLVAPGVRIPWGIERFTGISNEMVADAPPFEQLAQELRARLDGRLFVAHNARFDYGFLRCEYQRLGQRFSAPVLCTVRLSRIVSAAQRRHDLDTLIERHGLSCTARHRALGDARVLPGLLGALERVAGPQQIVAAIEQARREPRLPPQLRPGLADELPDGPGVYLFRDESAALIYVGKSKSLRARVLEHFASEQRSGKGLELSRLVREVEWIETCGELGALLLESRLVKTLAPTRNRRLRKAQQAVCLRLLDTPQGLEPAFLELDAQAFDDAGEAYGPFRSARDARKALERIARDQRLCMKQLGFEHGAGSCFGYQVGRCRGACVGRESAALHSTRTRLALVKLRLRPWPFAGAVAIRETAADGRVALQVCERWQHLCTIVDGRELEPVADRDAPFDLDVQQILQAQLVRVAPGDLLPWPMQLRE